MSIRLYVGNLPEDLSRQELEAVFADEGDSLSIKIITDRKTNKCRGFGFVTVNSEEKADEIIEKFNGYQLKENALKVERAQPRAKDTADEDSPAPSAPVPAGTASGGARRKGSGNSGSNNKSRRAGATQAESDSVQPDPRWAQELEKLKQLLAAQTTNT